MPNEPAAVVVAHALSKVYSGGVTAIDAVELAAAPGAITALVGANGAGKTTLLRLLAGALAPSSGAVELLGLHQPAAHARALGRLQSSLAYVDQDPALDPEMTGGETLRLLAALYGIASSGRGALIEALATRLGIAALLPRRVATYSGGQKRRLHLACALLHSPAVIFLDEPTAGLDAEGARFVWDELDRRTQAGVTVLLVGHDLEEIEREAAAVVMLDRGKVIAAGSPAALVAAHARTWLRVTLRQPPDDASVLLRDVAALPGFSRASCEGRRLWTQADDPELAPARLGELLAAIGAPIADVVVHRRDLASVYRTLTGRELESQPRPNPRRGMRR